MQIAAEHFQLMGVVGVFNVEDSAGYGAVSGEAGITDRHDDLLDFAAAFDF